MWNLISSIPIRAAQIPQQDMAIEVTDLTKHSKPKADLHLEVTNRGVKWVVHIVSNVRAKGPIIGTITKHIGEW